MTFFSLKGSHIWDAPVYDARRAHIRKVMAAYRAQRRVFLGPYVTLGFENVWTLWYQIQEMLAVERGGDAQRADELEAYNSLMPQKAQWVATMMIEIPDPLQRAEVLGRLTHLDRTLVLQGASGSAIRAEPIDSEGRTREDGKTSSVHFLRFDLKEIQDVQAFGQRDICFQIDHPAYRHLTLLTDEQKKTLLHELSLEWNIPCPFDPLFVLT